MPRTLTVDPEAALDDWLRKLRTRTVEIRQWRGHLYYKLEPEVVIAPAEDAIYMDRINRAIRESRTWGDFRRAVPKEYDWVFEEYRDEGRERPADTDPFDKDMISGIGDGDYPRWLQQEALQWLPAAAITECVNIGWSMVSGACPTIARENVFRLMMILKDEGYMLEHRPDLEFH